MSDWAEDMVLRLWMETMNTTGRATKTAEALREVYERGRADGAKDGLMDAWGRAVEIKRLADAPCGQSASVQARQDGLREAARSIAAYCVDRVARLGDTPEMPRRFHAVELAKVGERGLVVRIDVDGEWIDVIQETWPGEEGAIGHIVEPLGIEAACRRKGE